MSGCFAYHKNRTHSWVVSIGYRRLATGHVAECEFNFGCGLTFRGLSEFTRGGLTFRYTSWSLYGLGWTRRSPHFELAFRYRSKYRTLASPPGFVADENFAARPPVVGDRPDSRARNSKGDQSRAIAARHENIGEDKLAQRAGYKAGWCEWGAEPIKTRYAHLNVITWECNCVEEFVIQAA